MYGHDHIGIENMSEVVLILWQKCLGGTQDEKGWETLMYAQIMYAQSKVTGSVLLLHSQTAHAFLKR